MDKTFPHIRPLMLTALMLAITVAAMAQAENIRPERTPEQEAAKQTEALQRIITLTSEQVEQIQAINLKFAIERQHSTSRAEAVDRIRRKNEEYRRVLTEEQYQQLQNNRRESRACPPTRDRIRPEIKIDNKPSRPVRTDF